MGEKGARYSDDVGTLADEVADALSGLGEVTWRKMFGGAGVFIDDRMFALIDSDARLYLKADDSNRGRYESAGAERHGRMPYFAAPEAILEDTDALVEWASDSAALARSA